MDWWLALFGILAAEAIGERDQERGAIPEISGPGPRIPGEISSQVDIIGPWWPTEEDE